MKKQTFWKLILMLLPIAAVGLATTVNSVMVFDPLTGEVAYHSYFALVEAGTLTMAAPMAAVLSLVSGILAAVYLGAKKMGCLNAVVWTAFASAIFAVLPVLVPGNVKVVPNVMLPILMLAQSALAYVMGKKPQDQEKASGPRLDRH